MAADRECGGLHHVRKPCVQEVGAKLGPPEDHHNPGSKTDSEAPIAPFPATHRALDADELEWSDDEVGIGEEAVRHEADPAEVEDEKGQKREEEPRDVVVEEQRGEVKIDEKYSLESSVRELKQECKAHGLATSGTKAKILRRLENFRADLETKMQADPRARAQSGGNSCAQETGP